MSTSGSPLKDYSSHLREKHLSIVRGHFEDLVTRSGVDEEQNVRTVQQIEVLDRSLSADKSRRARWRALLVAVVLGASTLTALAFVNGGVFWVGVLPAVLLVFVVFRWITPALKKIKSELSETSRQRGLKMEEALAQMNPLNELHTWDATQRLFAEAFPDIGLDRYLSDARLADLGTNFGLSPAFNEGRSVLVTQGGHHLGNPFAFVRYLQHWIGTTTYTGSIVIYWLEEEQDDDGNWYTVERSQVLTASVTKPLPMFGERTNLLFGHEAAPNLSFSRTPSSLSGAEDGFLNNWRKDSAIKKVERKARREVKSGDSQFTMMANRDFEAQFNATDRDHEVEFRLLFSPFAQQEMVDLLNDRTIGYGDNFIFQKAGVLNFVESQHMGSIQFHGHPSMFWSHSLAAARNGFVQFHAEYFRSMFFSLAPLLTVPLYKEKRSAVPALSEGQDRTISAWECEALANAMGEDVFRHPESITRNIVRASVSTAPSGATRVDLTAFGYKGIEQVEIVPMLGGDGNVHGVPVHWIEYIPVSRQSSMMVWPLQTSMVDVDPSSSQPLIEQFDRDRRDLGIADDRVFVRNALAGVIL